MSKSEKPVAIVTGSSRGVGASTAMKLAQHGWNVTITCSSSEKAALEVSDKCQALGAETLVIKSDVSEEKNCKNVVEETITKWNILETYYYISTTNVSVSGNKTEQFGYLLLCMYTFVHSIR